MPMHTSEGDYVTTAWTTEMVQDRNASNAGNRGLIMNLVGVARGSWAMI